MSGDEPGVIAITQRELLLEMREDIRGLKATVDEIARDQALGAERRANMQRSADAIYARLDAHDRDLVDTYRVPTLDVRTGRDTARLYSRAKVIDMIFFTEGAGG